MHTHHHRWSTLEARFRRLLLTSGVILGGIFAVSAGDAHAAAPCHFSDHYIPESTRYNVYSEWFAPGDHAAIYPQADQIWAGVWFTGTNGPNGWPGTSSEWWSTYPATGVPKYSLL